MGADNRDAIVDAVVARMKTITTANGYTTNAGKNVSRWRSASVSPSECPAIDVRDPDRRLLQTLTGGVKDYELTLEITGFASSGADADGKLNDIIADIMKAVLEGDVTWGGLAKDTRYESDRKGFDQRDVKVALAVVRFQVHYRKT